MSAETAAPNPWPLRGFAAGLIIVCLVGAWHLRVLRKLRR